MKCDYLIVGSGFFGSVLAERIANDLNGKVVVIDKRSHVGGNCFSEKDEETGIEFHKYGTHIFHTSSKKAWDYIGQFTEFNNYHHQVLTTYKNRVYQMPINLETINSFYNLNLKPFEVAAFIKKEIEKEGIRDPKNLEEKAISLIGRPLYEAFIKGYTMKQWDADPRNLPAKIITRLPVRHNYREDYFVTSRWQGIPFEGYTKIFHNLLKSPNINLMLDCDFFQHRDEFEVKEKIIYTGPIDRYFNYVHGQLEWRSIVLQKETKDVEDYQGTAVMNYADAEIKYTRVHEPRHLHSEREYSKSKTIIFYEYSKNDPNEPFYPINTERNQLIFQKYKELAQKEKQVIMGGRLGNYAYYDMDETILASLKCYETQIKNGA